MLLFWIKFDEKKNFFVKSFWKKIFVKKFVKGFSYNPKIKNLWLLSPGRMYEASTAYGDSAEAKDHTRVSEEEEEEKIWKKINKSLTILFEF